MQGDLDGRGNLSARALVVFSEWFLRVCLDQIRFMEELFDIDGLSTRIARYAQIKGWGPEASTCSWRSCTAARLRVATPPR